MPATATKTLQEIRNELLSNSPYKNLEGVDPKTIQSLICAYANGVLDMEAEALKNEY